MSMFQPQNYGADFIGGMSAMSNMVNDRRRLDMDEKRQAEEEKTRAIQRDTATLDNQRTAQALETEKNLQAFLTHARDWDNGQITKEGLATLNRVTPELVKETPYVSDKIEDFPARRQANNVLAKGVESISTLPPGNYIYTRADNLPEINQTLDAYQMNLPPERFNKEFVDKDGTVTGKPGTVYKTTGVGGFAMMSGDGRDAAFTPMFSVADAQGNPMVKPDGKPLLVPATVNGSNDPNDPVRKIRPEEILTKIGFANKLMDTAEKLVGTADKRKEYVAQQAPYYMGQEGLKEIYQSSVKDNGVFERDPHKELRKKDGTLLAAAEPKEDKERAPSNLFGEGVKGSDLAKQFPEAKNLKPNAYYRVSKDNGKYYFAEERAPREPKQPADPAVAEGKRAERESKAAIDKAIDEIKGARQRLASAQKSGFGPGDADYDNAAQELADAKTGYQNRTKEHKTSFGRDYNPIKEVVERKPPRDISPLKDDFTTGGIAPDKYIASAVSKGWKIDEIRKAAKGTKYEEAANAYSGTPQRAAAPAPPKPQAKAPQRQQTAKNDTRPPLSAFNKGR